MGNYNVTFRIEAKRIDSLRKKLEGIFGEDQVSFQIERQKKYESRADRLGQAEGLISDANSVVEELQNEMEEWRDSIPENLQGGNKYSEIEEAVSNLEQLHDELEGIDFGNVSFPSMF